MPCYYPLTGYVSRRPSPKGKYPIVFNIHDGWADRKVTLPCGRCIGCRLERSRQWAMRCVHEASMYDNNCFITLTYRDERLPVDGSLDLTVFQRFMKRLRKAYGPGIRFFHCGEYGSEFARPHYHACLFNFDFSDRVFLKENNGCRLFTSKSLIDLWCDSNGIDLPKPAGWIGYYNPKAIGFSTVGDVTFESAAYVARYCTKKVTGINAETHYCGLKPEYVTMSRGCKRLKTGGIGYSWFQKWKDDVFPLDHVIVRGHECKPAKYYDDLYSLTNEQEMDIIKDVRNELARLNPDENRPARLAVREKVVLHNAANLRRGYEANGV